MNFKFSWHFCWKHPFTHLGNHLIWYARVYSRLSIDLPMCLSLASTEFSVNVVCSHFEMRNFESLNPVFSFVLKIFIYSLILCVCAWVYVCLHMCRNLWRWEENVSFPGTGGCEPCECWKPNRALLRAPRALNNSAVSPTSTLLFFKRTFWLYGEPSRCHMSFRTGFSYICC